MAVRRTCRSSRGLGAPTACAVAAVLSASIVAASPASAAAGKLVAYSSAESIALQPDGRILVAGWTHRCDPDPEEPCVDPAVVVVRYLPSGRIDRSFGGGDGVVEIPAGGEHFRDEHPGITGLAVQDDGKIVVGAVTGGPLSSLLVRLSARGRLDRGFGGDGKVTTPFGSYVATESGNGLAVAADGSILVVGTRATSMIRGDFAAARYLPDGTLDPGFGAAGVASVHVMEGGVEQYEWGRAIALCPNGRILLAGSADNGFVATMAAAQLDATGQPDEAFGEGGRATSTPVRQAAGPLDPSTDALALAIQPDGSALLAGYRDVYLSLARLSEGGAPVSGFGDGGLAVSQTPDGEIATDVALQGDRIVVTGPGSDIHPSYVVLIRYNDDGSWDQTFAQGTGLTHFKVAGFESAARSLEIASGGRILAAGFVSSDECALARARSKGSSLCEAMTLLQLMPNGRLDPKFGRGGIVTTPRIDVCAKAPTKRCRAGERAV